MSYFDKTNCPFETKSDLQRQEMSFSAIRNVDSALGTFDSVMELIRFLRDESESPSDARQKDAVLLELVKAHQTEPRRGAFAILCNAMRPGIDSVFNSLRGKVPRTQDGLDELRSSVLAALVDVLDSFPTETRRASIAASLRLDTLKRTIGAWRAGIAEMEGRAALEAEIVPTLDRIHGLRLFDFASSPTSYEDLAEELGAARRTLDLMRSGGLLSPRDHALVVAVHIEGRELKAMARELKVSPDAIRKRIDRAFERIRNEGEKFLRSRQKRNRRRK